MKKEDCGDFLNSKDGKVNAVLLVSIALIFILSLYFAEAVTVRLVTPTNVSYNGSRNINVTFNATWDLAGDTVQNCSIWTNQTAAWERVAINNSQSNVSNWTGGGGAGFLTSWINFTYSNDGNFTFSVGCINSSDAGVYTFAANRTFFIDSLAPTLTLDTPYGGILADTTSYNITSYATATFYVNVSDNSTNTVWVILNKNATVTTLAPNHGQNESVNRSMTAGTVISNPDRKQYYFNMSYILNINSNFTSPGPHSVAFCANDTFNRVTCTNRSDFIIKGLNVTQLENAFTVMFQPGGLSFGGLNITLGNGTEIPVNTFLNPIDGVSVGGLTHKNFTFIINFSNNIIIHIVAGTIDENQFGNVTNTKVNNTPTTEISQQLGTGFSASLGWADIASFIPSEVIYQYGMIQIGGTSFSKKMYCNGTSMAAPNCHPISQCNGTVFGIYNHSIVIPTNDACWLESGTINTEALASGFTYLFVDKFSGGLGGSDFSQANTTFNGPLFDRLNTTTTSYVVNFTLEDINSTGFNLTMNSSINVTFLQGGSVARYYTFLTVGSNLTCTSSDATSPQNTTSVTCNTTVVFSNGTYVLNVTARDTSNNSNPANVTVSFITITVDQIPPQFHYFNITDTPLNATAVPLVSNGTELNNSPGRSTAQGNTIYAIANWTDNLTVPQIGLFQFFNTTTGGGWQTLNSSNVTFNDSGYFVNGGWTNFSFPIPTGHNNFEGQNISFRILTNDTVGNTVAGTINSSGTKNFTIWINDTTRPTIVVTIGSTPDVNGTNTSDTTPMIVWNITENNALRYVAVEIDNSGPTGADCSKFINRTVANGLVESNRNNTLTISGSGTCPLSNGTHIARVTAEDSWNNTGYYLHNFTVQTGEGHNITLGMINTSTNRGGFPVLSVNGTNLTPHHFISFNVTFDGGAAGLRNITWTSSCNSSTFNTVGNATLFTPFNYTACLNTEANRTVTVTAYDTAGNSITKVFQFLVDDVGPSIAVSSPTNGLRSVDNLTISLSAKDGTREISFFGYFLDGTDVPVRLNASSPWTNGPAVNVSLVNVSNFTAGTHTIKFTVNDTLGNVANSSIITFTQTGPVVFANINTSIEAYMEKVFNDNITNVSIRIKTAVGSYEDITATNETSTNTFEVLFQMNGSGGSGFINISLTEINGSATNWNKTSFTPYVNQTSFRAGLTNNWTNTILSSVWFNSSIQEFITNNNSYYGVVVLPLNISGNTSTAREFWWMEKEDVLTTRTNISQCEGGFGPTSTTPCWNYTSGGRTIIQVPHFSIVVAVNDTTAPTIAVNTPSSTIGNHTVSMFDSNITVSSDTISCKFVVNSTGPTANKTMAQSGTTCIGETESFKTNNAIYNITFYATDSANNVGTLIFRLNVSDTTAPNNGEITSSGTTTGATITITGTNESVNATVFYGATNTSLSSSETSGGTDFNVTQTVTISSLSTVSSATIYHYNISVCDFNGNCKRNGTFTFTQTATAAAAAAAAAAAGGGGGAAAPSNEVATGARKWDSLGAGTSAVLTINNEKVAVTGVIIDVKNAVTNAEVKVASLASNPIATAAAAKVYQYLQITRSNIADADTSKIAINFRVPKSWLTTNNVGENDVVLYRYSESKWNGLPTSRTGADANNVLYQSTTPGFSTFAVGSKEAAPAVAPPAEAPPAEAPAVPTAEVPKEAEKPAVPPVEKKPLSTTAIAWIVVAIIVVVAAIGYFMWQKKRSE